MKMLKKFLKVSCLALCGLLMCGTIAGCGGTETVESSDLGFYFFESSNHQVAVKIDDSNIKEVGKNKKIVIEVPDDTNCIEVDVKPFLEKNQSVLGKNFTFSRTDMSGTGYVYEQVDTDEESTGAMWKRHSEEDRTARAKMNLPAGPKMFITNEEDARQPMYLFANRDDASAVFNRSEKRFRIVFNGNDGKTYKTEIAVRTPTMQEQK